MPLLLWLGCLAVAVALLVTLGQGRLAAPDLTDPASWRAWAVGRDPLEVTMVVLRLLALGCAWYLTGITSISVVARVLRAVRLVQLADALSVGPVKHLVQQAVGISLAAGVLAAAVPAPVVTGRAAAGARGGEVAELAVMTAVDDDPQDAGGTTAVPVMVPVPALQRTAEPPPLAQPAAQPTAPAAPPVPEVAPDATARADPESDAEPAPGRTGPVDERHEVRIQPGDHFWALAEQAVAGHLGRPGTDREVVAHWEAILVANADRLVAAGNPDLLLPGQLVVLPPVEEVVG